MNSQKTNSLAVAGFILSFTVPPLGIIFSIIGLVKAKNYNGDGKTLSIIGIVTSLVMSVMMLLIVIALVAASFSNIKQKANEATQKSQENASRYNAAQIETLELGDSYNDKTGSYSVILPKGWKVEEVKQNQVYVHEIANPIVSDVSIAYNKAKPDETLATTVDTLENSDNMTVSSKGKLTINGVDGYEIVAIGNNLATYLVSLTKNNTTYSLAYVTSPDNADNYLPVFKMSARSFVVKQ